MGGCKESGEREGSWRGPIISNNSFQFRIIISKTSNDAEKV